MATERSEAVGVVSAVIGWLYFACWCVTFWPQPVLNWQRQRVTGLSLEYVAYQCTGFVAYTLYSIVSYVLENEAARTDPSVVVSVRPNDLAFTCHALLMTCIVIGQCVRYERTSTPRISPVHRYALLALWTCLAFALLLAVTGSLPYACVGPSCPATHLTLLSTLGLTKVVVNLVKNLPQLLLNHRRQSTVGWSVWGVWTDVVGASAAFVQQALDVWNLDDWDMMKDNAPKLLLSVLSFIFDCVFLVQHHLLYTNREEVKAEGEGETGEEGVEEGEAGEGSAEGAGKGWEADDEKEGAGEAQRAAKAKAKEKLTWTGYGELLLKAGEQEGSVNM